MIRQLHLLTIFHIKQIRKLPQLPQLSQRILVASFTQSSVSHQYFKKLNPFGHKKAKEEDLNNNNEENDLDNSELIVIDELKPILKDDFITRPEKITDPTEIKKNIFVIIQKYVDLAEGDLMQLKLKDSKLKFEILRDCMMVIGKRIPNLELNKINTVKDVIDFFIHQDKPDQRKGHPVAEWFIRHKDELPSNMLFIPYVKERGVNREDRSKRQRRSKLEKQKIS